MAINTNILNPRLADRRLSLVAAAMFPLLVLIGYARTYYFSSFFDVKPLANALVHAHAVVMLVIATQVVNMILPASQAWINLVASFAL